MSDKTQFFCVSLVLLVLIVVVVMSASQNLNGSIVPRSEWGARPAKLVQYVHTPVPYVIVHHSYQPAVCWTPETCAKAMRSMQLFHQEDNGWNDIGYNFGIGGDGRIYEGRGFDVEGAHAPRYNNRSIGICVIGDWRVDLPTPQMLSAVNRIIRVGVQNGHVHPDYTLLGHRQTRPTECPGDRLFAEIQGWPHFENLPAVAEAENATTAGTTTTTMMTMTSSSTSTDL